MLIQSVVTIDDETYPDLFEILEPLGPRDRAEALRYYARLGMRRSTRKLLPEDGGIVQLLSRSDKE